MIGNIFTADELKAAMDRDDELESIAKMRSDAFGWYRVACMANDRLFSTQSEEQIVAALAKAKADMEEELAVASKREAELVPLTEREELALRLIQKLKTK